MSAATVKANKYDPLRRFLSADTAAPLDLPPLNWSRFRVRISGSGKAPSALSPLRWVVEFADA